MDQVQLPDIPQHKKKNILLVEIGFFEMGFVVLVLGIIFFLLNFLGLVPFGKQFPFLAFLPTFQTTFHAPLSTTSVNSPQHLLTNYLQDHMQSSALPTNLSEPSTVPSFKNKTIVSEQWTSKLYTPIIGLYYNIDTKNPQNNIQKLIITIDNATSSLSAQTADTIFFPYFKQTYPHPSWKCTTNPNQIACNYNTTDSVGKTFYGISFITQDKTLDLHVCTVPRGNKYFQSTSGC